MTKLDKLRSMAESSVEQGVQETAINAARLAKELSDETEKELTLPTQFVKSSSEMCSEIDDACVSAIAELEEARNTELNAIRLQKSELQGDYNLKVLNLTKYYDQVGPNTKAGIDSQIAGWRLKLEEDIAALNFKQAQVEQAYEQQIAAHVSIAEDSKSRAANTPSIELTKKISSLVPAEHSSLSSLKESGSELGNALASKAGMIDRKTLLLSAGVVASILLLGAGGAALYGSLTHARVQQPDTYKIGSVIVVGDGLSGNTIDEVARFCGQDPALSGDFTSAAAKAIVEQSTDGTLTVDTILNGFESYFLKPSTNP